MKLITALVIGVVMGFILPMVMGGRGGLWLDSFAGWGTVRPLAGSPALLFSIPVFLLATFGLWTFFNWHNR